MTAGSEFPLKKQELFLRALAETGNVTASCELAGVERRLAYYYRKNRPQFAKCWEVALEASTDELELEARRRALDGVEEPVFYKGEEIAKVRKPSDVLMMFLLNGLKPDVYKRRTEVTGKDGGAVALTIASLVVEDPDEMKAKPEPDLLTEGKDDDADET